MGKPKNAATIGQRLAYWGVASGLAVLKALPPDAASALGGWMMRAIGPLLWRHRVAHDNLARVFPDMPAAERRRVVRRMWANFGRTAGEYPHLETILGDPGRIEVAGIKDVRAALDGHEAAIIVSAHFGNWEVAASAATVLGLPSVHIYRPLDNPDLERLIMPLMRAPAPAGLIKKSEATAIRLIRALRQGTTIAFLADHRERNGIVVPFLGIDAETVHSPALVARRTGAPIIVARGLRTGGARFRLECQPLAVPVTDDRRDDILVTTRRINDIFSEWIRERPDQYYWLHRRWKTKADKQKKPIAAAGAPHRQAAPSRR